MRIAIAASLALAVALGATAILNPAGSAAAEPGAPHGRLERLQTRLALTDDQMKAIQEIYARDAETQRQLFRSLRLAQSDLRRLALSNADPTAIEQKTAEIEGLLAQSLQLRVRHLQEIAPLLTPEQRDRFAQMPPMPWKPRHPHGRHEPRSS